MQVQGGGGPIGTQAFHTLDFDPVDGVFLFLTEYDSGSRMWAYRYGSGAAVPTLSVDDVTVTEGNAGTTAAVVTARLSQPSAQPVTASFATANGTATAGSDYQAATGTVTFPAGTVSRTIGVNVIGDAAVEPDETFVLNLTASRGRDARATGRARSRSRTTTRRRSPRASSRTARASRTTSRRRRARRARTRSASTRRRARRTR